MAGRPVADVLLFQLGETSRAFGERAAACCVGSAAVGKPVQRGCDLFVDIFARLSQRQQGGNRRGAVSNRGRAHNLHCPLASGGARGTGTGRGSVPVEARRA